MKGGVRLGQALGARRSRCPGDGRGPGTPPQALRGVGRVCRRSPCTSRLAEALAVGGRAASESLQRAGVRTRLLWLRLTVR